MLRNTSLLIGLVALTVLTIGRAARAGDAIHLDLGSPGWELAGDGTVVEQIDGRPVLRLMSGGAVYRDLEFLDGTIELDMRVTKYRSFAFLYFRMESDGEREEVYFRPHKSLLPDAIQYTPVYRGSSQWQLYHDDRATAVAELPASEWIHVRLVVRGSRAAVFVGAAKEPQLVVPRLAREPRPGYLALRSFRPRGAPTDTHLVEFADVVVRPGVVDYDFPEAEPPAPLDGRVTHWQLSPSFAPAEGPVIQLPPEIPGEWQTVAANADGLVELERYLNRPQGARRAAVLAKLRITAEEAATRRLDLGFSDEASVFLNGRLLVVADDSYSFNLPRRQGLLTGDQLSVFLPLEKGANDLVLAITDRFGGWGLSGVLEMAGLAIELSAKAAAPPRQSARARPAQGIAQLSWLAGCWHGEGGEECWLAPRGGTMIAINRGPDRADRPPSFELLRVVESGDGLVLLAQPGGRSPATPFRATEVGDARVVFENPEHDFPQRITYRLDGDTLRARVEARRFGEWQGFEQTWSRGVWPGE